jgi:acetate kinase
MAIGLVVFNAGSSSLKFSLYRIDSSAADPQRVATGHAVGIGGPRVNVWTQSRDGSVQSEFVQHEVANDNDAAIVQFIMAWAETQASDAPLAAAGHRIVHGGARFKAPTLLNEATIAALDDLVALAPLHMPRDLRPVRALAASHPELAQIACFDTAFHCTLPPVERQLGLPRALIQEHGLYRYGFHGLSYEFIADELRRIDPATASGRVVVAHLGSGASLCAMVDGRSVATTMGFSTLDGLLMSTRCGDLDPGALLYLLRHSPTDAGALEHMLYRESGLLGVSGGISGDLRTLITSSSQEAQEAVALFVYRIRRELGAMVAAAGGIDALVFTGGVGEHAAEIRAAVVHDAAWLGLKLDSAANTGDAVRIDAGDSGVSIWRMATDENQAIARHCARILGLWAPDYQCP